MNPARPAQAGTGRRGRTMVGKWARAPYVGGIAGRVPIDPWTIP